MKRVLPFLLVLSLGAPASAHRPSDSYLQLSRAEPQLLSGVWDIALRDLDHALALDDGDGALTWGELSAREHECTRYALASLHIGSAAGPCAIDVAPLQIVELSDGAYARLPLAIRCPPGAGELSLDYRLLAELDRDHRAIVRSGSAVHVVSATQGALRLPAPEAAASPGLLAFVGQGLEHIFAGLDHILFLLVLLVPCVLRPGARAPRGELRPVLREVVKIVTAFTLAHSLTLSLAALGAIRVSAAVIEPAIAASVALAALNNLVPLFDSDRWAAALALGLLHGFGFSSALADAGLSGRSLLPALLGFNLGVELGQLAIVACFVPLAFLARKTHGYRTLGVRGASLVVLAVSLFWLFERIQVG